MNDPGKGGINIKLSGISGRQLSLRDEEDYLLKKLSSDVCFACSFRNACGSSSQKIFSNFESLKLA